MIVDKATISFTDGMAIVAIELTNGQAQPNHDFVTSCAPVAADSSVPLIEVVYF